MIPYTPHNWFWRASDGRVFASARQVTVTEADAGYGAFLAAGGTATPWPRDAAGDQTDAALAAVLQPYGLAISVAADLADYAAAKRRAVLDLPAATLKGRCWCDQGTRSDLGQLIQFIDEGLAVAPVSFKLVDGFATMTRSEIVAVAGAVGARVMAAFSIEALILAAIEAGTITTKAEIDDPTSVGIQPWPGA